MWSTRVASYDLIRAFNAFVYGGDTYKAGTRRRSYPPNPSPSSGGRYRRKRSMEGERRSSRRGALIESIELLLDDRSGRQVGGGID